MPRILLTPYPKGFLVDVMEFWNDEITEKSWKKLIGLRKEIDFVLIGGWAVYLYTKLHKSKDIDMIIDYPVLRKLQNDYILNKNSRLKKYEVKLPEGFDIDIYTPGYSRLTIPIKDIMSNIRMREGFRVPRQEILLLLKLGACADRKASIKGSKDSIDIMGLVFNTDIDYKFLKELVTGYGLENYLKELLHVFENFDISMIRYIDLNVNSFSKLKKKYKQLILSII